MAEPGTAGTRKRNRVNRQQALAMRDKIDPDTGKLYTQGKIAEHFDVTRQAIGFLFKEHDKSQGKAASTSRWPWVLSVSHCQGSTYRAMLAFDKFVHNEPMASDELALGKALLAFAERIDGAVTYDEDKGFRWVKRRKHERDQYQYFVER